MPVASPEVQESAFTGRLGALYDLTSWASPYLSVSQSFNPQSSGTFDRSGNLLDPEEGLQYEAGVKFQFFQERLLATVAAYDIEKSNVAVFDQAFFDLTGAETSFPGIRQRSRGLELDVSGKITSNLSVIANYAYTDTEVLENQEDPDTVGQALGGVPLHTARASLAYNFKPGSTLAGFGFGAGVRYEDERTALFENELTLDSFVLFDAGVWYRKSLNSGQVFTAQLNVQNLTDEEYYPRASTRAIVHPGEPLSVIGSIGLEF